MADWLVAGAGIGGLATALALQHTGLHSQIWEQAKSFGEVGAGIQMGPNVTRILQQWGLDAALKQVAVQPQALVSCDAVSGQELGRLDLRTAADRYGAPYLTIHRADLHALLLQKLDPARVSTRLGCTLSDVQVQPDGALKVYNDQGVVSEPAALIGADGLWSRVREIWGTDGVPLPTGHWAYRALLPTRLLSPRWREPLVRVWMAPGLHAVHYPVRRGEWLNVVVLVEARLHAAQKSWDVPLDPAQIRADVHAALRGLCADLHDVLRPVETWRAWSLWARPPVAGADQMARGRVALLGDAAHPMLPYLAQGAGMAIEDAWQLAQCVQSSGNANDVAGILAAYAQARWARNARVQRHAQRNGAIFHASGPVAWARNTALRWAAPRLMDQPWLYGAA
jgi:salicylate hydroxylase